MTTSETNFNKAGPVSLALLGMMVSALVLPAKVHGQIYDSRDYEFLLQTVTNGLEHPWSMVFLPDDSILVTERQGHLRLIEDGDLKETPIEGLPDIVAQGQGGLLDIALHPEFEVNRWVYFTYADTAESGDGLSTHLARAKFQQGPLVGQTLTDTEVLFSAYPGMSGGRHFGSRIVFDDDQYLYMTLGDRGTSSTAQDTLSHAGSTIRLHDDGSVPEDNPFVGDDGGLDELYTWGNRNAQGMAVHPETGEVWQHEHGPRGGDEINLIQSGLNYGWPEVTHGTHYDGSTITEHTSMEGMEDPLVHWTPSIAPSGMTFYTGEVFPEWTGDLFVGALAGQKVQRLRFDGTTLVEQEDLLETFNTRIRDIRTGPDGTLWLLTDEENGRLMRFVR